MWEDRSLRDVTESDVRQLVQAGVEEHLQLDYKADLYDRSDRGNKELLLDLCMFANAGGGLLLLGVPEARDENNQPTGRPNPNAELGIELANPEQLLQAYDARAVSNIEERLKIDSKSIPLANSRCVLAIRVHNSLSKPHCVRYQGEHVYFPSRRERHRYYMDVQEIKDMVLRTASRLDDAEQKLLTSFRGVTIDDTQPRLLIGVIPVFNRDFILNVRDSRAIEATMRWGQRQPQFNFTGLEAIVSNDNSVVQVRRNGLILLHRRLPGQIEHNGGWAFYPEAIDILLREFVINAARVYQAAELSGPFLLGMMLRLRIALVGKRQVVPGETETLGVLPISDYAFPVMQTPSLSDIDRTISALCDQAHQMFGRRSSTKFDTQGRWIER
jgi:Putative DNA-binding domain